MYTDRQLKIIAVLKSADGWMSGSLLRENIGVSSRTLQMDIKAINEKQSGEPLIQSNNRLGYLLKNKIALEQEQKSYGQENYVHSKQIITLLLFEKEYTSIGTISERLFFSRSSVSSDLPQVKRIISRTPGANLLVSGQYGLKIQASENVKRIMCMKTMQSRQDYHMLFSEEEMEQFAENQKKLQAVLAEVFTRNQFIVSGEAYHDFARYLAVCMMRSQMGFPVTEEEDGTTEMPGRLSTELVDEIEKVCTYRFKEKEKQNVEARLKELNMVCKETDIQLDMLQKLEVFIQRVQEEKIPCILCINKIDTVEPAQLLPVIAAYNEVWDGFDAIIPISAHSRSGLDDLMQELQKYAQEGPQLFPDGETTDQPERQVMGELLREKLLLCLDKEIPHGTAIEITKFSERDSGVVDVDATIYCEKASHKGIIIGKQGAMLKKISSLARADMEKFMGTKVFLQTWVKVKENWRDNLNYVRSLGYRDE